ncbi:MAG: cysteine desulfurase family protein [Patescibacteria group bacterium]
MNKPSRIYLDYAASTPVEPAVLKVMMPYFAEKFGNPGSLHSFGQEAIGAMDKARGAVAKAVGADFRNIIFTGSATEANNLALRGTVKGFLPKIIVGCIEHESILDTARELEKEGIEVVYVPVDKNGIVDLKKLEKALDERTALVSVMHVNNEIGSIQPIAEIAKIIRNFRNSKPEARNPKQIPNSKNQIQKSVSDLGFRNSDLVKKYPLFHVDAAQALNYFDCDADNLGADLMTLSGQKIYGPKGVGALYMRSTKFEARNSKQNQNSKFQTQNRVSDLGFRNSDLQLVKPIVTGGGQEFGLRSGTENIPAIIGFGKAVELAVKDRSKNTKEVKSLRDEFWRGLKKIYPQAEINGKSDAPHILNIYFPTEFAGDLLVKLDMAGIAVSAGSACSARSYVPSPVLQALGLPQERVRGSLRFSFGKTLGTGEIKEALKRIGKILR